MSKEKLTRLNELLNSVQIDSQSSAIEGLLSTIDSHKKSIVHNSTKIDRLDKSDPEFYPKRQACYDELYRLENLISELKYELNGRLKNYLDFHKNKFVSNSTIEDHLTRVIIFYLFHKDLDTNLNKFGHAVEDKLDFENARRILTDSSLELDKAIKSLNSEDEERIDLLLGMKEAYNNYFEAFENSKKEYEKMVKKRDDTISKIARSKEKLEKSYDKIGDVDTSEKSSLWGKLKQIVNEKRKDFISDDIQSLEKSILDMEAELGSLASQAEYMQGLYIAAKDEYDNFMKKVDGFFGERHHLLFMKQQFLVKKGFFSKLFGG
ncbi:MAG: hypothetical protein IAE91_01545 [Ignavibacteriaceae bacterium]|nr:hypothetical protein [Ignavibacteriaceae bacterium]